MGVLSTPPVDFLEFFPRNRNHLDFSDDVGRHELQLVCHRKVGIVKLKMKTLSTVYSVALCNTAIKFCDRRSNRSFSSELLIFLLVLLMFWTYRSQKLLCFCNVSILHFQELFRCIGKVW